MCDMSEPVVNQMRICAVIVNYRTSETAISAIEALYPQIAQFPGSIITVVDNDSRDDSIEALTDLIKSKNWHETVQILDAGRNGGFGAGNNVAIRKALISENPPDYFFLINPDALPVRNTLKVFCDFLQNNPCAGIVGGTIKRPNGSQQISAFNFPNIIDEFVKGISVGFIRRLLIKHVVAPQILHDTRKVDWVSGACMMVRTEMLKDIGLFDESFFLYFEEIDLCRRAKGADWDVVHVVNGGVVHICGVATGITKKEKRTPGYLFHSRKYYFYKHHGCLYLVTGNIVFILARLVGNVKLIFQQKSSTERPKYLLDFVRNSF